MRQKQYQQYKARGLCGSCGARPSLPCRTQCLVCSERTIELHKTPVQREKRNAYMRMSRARRKANRQCVDCGILLNEYEGMRCFGCADVHIHGISHTKQGMDPTVLREVLNEANHPTRTNEL